MTYRPDIIIDNEILTLVSEIAVLIDRIPEKVATSRHLKLSRGKNIRTVHSTSAIEGNRLSLKEVTDIIDGKRVAGDPKDIREIKNAKKAYDLINKYDPFSVEDMLNAHRILMDGLVDMPGEFRDCGVGVYRGAEAVHIAPEHDDVPFLISELTDWCMETDIHPLIMSCVFHCRFEYIHPFVDGNGRMGRLWHSLMLSKWSPAFKYLPVESWINLNKKEYYSSLGEAHKGNISAFIKFMLLMIRMAADELADEVAYTSGKESDIKEEILKIISHDPGTTAAGMADMLGLSVRTVRRHLSSMAADGMIKRAGSDKTGHWEAVRASRPRKKGE
ncbi:MAG: Fic family protein [Methanomassiliicoccaceae archaeon]|nr:Fic family protein [Methanomassiliicoccaceae archaeon]